MFTVPSFSNPLADPDGDLVRFYLEVESGASPSKIEFAYNPTTFSLDRAVQWEDAKAMKEPYGVLNFTGGQSDTLSFQTLLDKTESDEPDILADVEDIYKLTRVQITENNYKRPPIVTLHWKDLSFVGVITSLKVDFTMFQEDGTPVRADVTMSLMGRAFTTDNAEDKFFAPFSG